MENRTADTILNDRAFDCMDKNTKEAFKRLYINIQGKPVQENLPVIIGFIKSLPKNVSFTTEQKKAMLGVLLSNTPERERKQIIDIIGIFGL